MEPQLSPLLSFLPFVLVGFVWAIPVYLLAKEKGRNPAKWTILALIPIFNAVALIYIVGTSSLRIEKKLDELLERRR